MDRTDRTDASGDPLGPTTRGPLATLVVLVVVAAVAIIGGIGVLPTPGPSPSASPAQASPTAATSPGDWAPVGDLPPLEPIAALAPTVVDSAGVGPESAFVLTSLGDVSASELAAGVTVEPAVGLRATPSDAGMTLTPSEPLTPGRRYRFDVRTPDQALAGSWAFTVKAPLHVVTTLPSEQSTDVPVDTGIELTFDQDGVTRAEERFSIEPAVKGRFETHGRTLVFVPARLEPMTLYTVTLAPGVGVAGSDVTLERPVRVRFETAGPSTPSTEPAIILGRTVIEVPPDEQAIVGLLIVGQEDEEGEAEAVVPERLPIEVYRLPDAAAAADAARALADAPYWASTSAGLVDTTGLTRVLAADARVRQVDSNDSALVLPQVLPPGVYVLVIPREGRDVQGLLQVTPLASYSLVSPTRSLFWVNAIDGGPLANVEVAIESGAVLGRTDADGLLEIETPRALLGGGKAGLGEIGDDSPVLVTLTSPAGDVAIVPLGLRSWLQSYPQDVHSEVDPAVLEAIAPTGDTQPGGAEAGWIEDDRYWKLLSSDRDAYRQTDTVNLWGYLRHRDSSRVPAEARITLLAGDEEFEPTDGPPLATQTVRPGPSGAFTASFPLEDLPLGSYRAELSVDGRPVASQWFQVTVIRKPAYELTASLDHHVRIDGQPVRATIGARFFEGSVAPGVDLRVSGGRRGASIVTGPDGTATTTLRLHTSGYDEGMSWVPVSAYVAGAEEGEISTESLVAVFPSTRWLAADGRLAGRRLRLRGTVSEVDVARLEAALDGGQPDDALDPAGDPIGRARVRARVIRYVPSRQLIGQRYDFITKRVVPEYDYQTREVTIATRDLRSDGRGRFDLAMTVPSSRDEYQVILTTKDARGREARTTVWIAPPDGLRDDVPRTTLEMPRQADGEAEVYGIGEPVRATLSDDVGGAYPARRGGFLFVTAQRGLRDAIVQDRPRFSHAFAAADAPNILLHGVHFTGRTFVSASEWATFDTSERALTVRLSTDKPRYRPGETANISARTTDADGRPVAATVVLRGVDEKLYALGAVADEDPLGRLHEHVGDGLYRSYTSHPLPRPLSGNGGGDTGGGREDFRDTLVFRQFETGPDGTGQVTIRLADDLTSWHLSGAAVTADLQAGAGSVALPVGLPFFVEITAAPEFVLADRPTLRLRAFGSDLAPGDPVAFTVASETLAMAPVTVTGVAFQPVDVPLPALKVGKHRVAVAGSAHAGALGDSLTRAFRVLPARATRTANDYASLDGPRGVESGPGLTTVVLTDAGRGRYVQVLEELAWEDGPRLDQALGAVVARDLLTTIFGRDPADFPEATFDAAAYQHDEGLALLPYSSASHDLTVRTLLVDPTRFDQANLRSAMQTIRDDPSQTRERRIMALAGSALLGEEVLPAVRDAAASTDLTVLEQLYLAVAAAELGDRALAIDLERDVVAEHGERRGPWLRVMLPASSDASVEATALLAIAMVDVGDPLAADAEAYVEANPLVDDLSSLQRLAFAERAIDRAPTAPSSFAYTVDGTRQVVDLEPGTSRTLTLTEDQARSLRLEPLAGKVGVAVTRHEPLDPASVSPDPKLTLTRTVTPSGVIDGAQTVTVDLGLTFGSQALTGCTAVVDLVPSGLAPIEDGTRRAEEGEEDEGEAAPTPTVDVLSPDSVAGQRVTFCASPDPRRSVIPMRYRARVVGPGTYAWEPASAQAVIASELTTLTPAASIDIR